MWRHVVWEIGNYVAAERASIPKMEAADYAETL